jgi:hypothetical protein
MNAVARAFVEFDILEGETLQQAADRALKAYQENRPKAVGALTPWGANLEHLMQAQTASPPTQEPLGWDERLFTDDMPETTRWGFTMGERVVINNKTACQGRFGNIVGFFDDFVIVEEDNAPDLKYWQPHFLAHAGEPQSMHGFTIGETVNLTQDCIGNRPGTVAGFTHEKVQVQWPYPLHAPGDLASHPPENLRHGE